MLSPRSRENEIQASLLNHADDTSPEHRIDIEEDGESSQIPRPPHREEENESLWDEQDDDEVVVPHHLKGHNENDNRSLINLLATELRNQTIPSYLEQFEVLIPDAELVVGSVPLEDIQQRELELEQARVRREELEAELHRQRELSLSKREYKIRTELELEAKKKQKALQHEKLQFAHTVALRTQRLGLVFQQAETRLKTVLSQQQARVKQVFGTLEPSHIPAERIRYRVEWNEIPVTLRIRAKMLRALKDRLPAGQYVVLVTLYDRLGGHALHWTAWDPEERDTHLSPRRRRRHRSGSLTPNLNRPHVTRPFTHRGRFYNTDVCINQNIYVVGPPLSQLRPSNVLVFEIFQLETNLPIKPIDPSATPMQLAHDQIVAWGAVPLITPDFTYIEGKYKIPLLRGEMDATMDKYRDIEDMYTRDLSAWLCNFYFQVAPLHSDMEQLITGPTASSKLPQNVRSTFDVEIDARNGLYRDNENAYVNESVVRIRKKKIPTHTADHTEASGSASTSATALIEEGDNFDKSNLGGLFSWRKQSSSNRIYSGDVVVPQMDAQNEVDTTTDDDALVVTAVKKKNLHRNNSSSASNPLAEDVDEDTENIHLDLENYVFSVNSALARETAHQKRFHASRKLHYIRHELVADVKKPTTMEFWLVIGLLAMALWFRVYIHYVAQYLFLKGNRIAVFYFKPQWTTCIVKYTWKTISTTMEMGVILVGVLGNSAFFVILAATAAISQTYVGELPAFGSIFIVCAGIAMILDPFLVFMVDLWQHQYNCSNQAKCLISTAATACTCVDGDAFKLYTRFLATEGSGLVGLILTLLLYAAVTCLSLFVFYLYLLHVHMNGRMLDVFRRIHAQETDLFLPHDCEISLQELHAICEQAVRWKGPRGTQRKVFVHDYVLGDPLDPSFEEKSTHIALYNVELDSGSRELHRHFIKSHDGAIVELFGEIGTGYGGTWQHDAVPSLSSLALIYNILQTTSASYEELSTPADLKALLRAL